MWWPAFWDAPPHAFLAEEAASCAHVDVETASGMRRAIRFCSACPNVSATSKKKPNLHNILHNIIKSALHKPDLDMTFAKRCATCFANVFVGHETLEWPAVRAVLKASKPFVASCNIKDWTSGWTTSSRMSEPEQRQCLFGCVPRERQLLHFSFFDSARDETAHYIACPPLWSSIGRATDDSLLWPLARCGRRPFSMARLRDVAETFVVYHFTKHDTTVASSESRLRAAQRIAHIACN